MSGPLAARLLADLGLTVGPVQVVPDGVEPVRRALTAALADGARVVLTTGGTGVSPTDRTPEATGTVLERTLPGIVEEVRRRSGTPAAVLSRAVAGTVGTAVVVNAPGSPDGVEDTVAVVGPLLGHLLEQLAGGDHG